MKTITHFKQSGLSILNILAILAAVAIIATLFVQRIIGHHEPSQSQINVAKRDISYLQQAMDAYRKDNGFYPSTTQGFAALVRQPLSSPLPNNWRPGGYVSQIPLDPWGRPFYYLNPGKNNPHTVDIFSFGPSGRPGGVGNKGVIGNWNYHTF